MQLPEIHITLTFTISSITALLIPIRYTGKEALSSLYSFTVWCLCPHGKLDDATAINKMARLHVATAAGSHVYTGVVTNIATIHTATDFNIYSVTFGPRFSLLQFGQYSRLFLGNDQDNLLGGKQVSDIFSEVCQSVALSPDAYDFSSMKKVDFKRHMICQYNESNYDFCARWLEHLGGYYYFAHTDQGEKLIALHQGTGPNSSPQEFTFHQGQGLHSTLTNTVSRFTMQQSFIPQKVRVQDYNPETPDTHISTTHVVSESGNGDVYLFDEFLRTPAEADFIARIRAEQILCNQKVYSGEAHTPGMRPGYTFTLTNHPHPAINAQYMVTAITHKGQQTGHLSRVMRVNLPQEFLDHENFYECSFTCIPAEVQYRPAQTTTKPLIQGTIIGKVDAEGSGKYAELDKHGRYKIVLPFENTIHPDGKASCYLRLAQPYAGANNGMHFPLVKGTDVAIGFTGGNPDRPYIESALPNAKNISVSTDKNQTQGVISSLSGNTIMYEDLSGQEHIKILNRVTSTVLIFGIFHIYHGIYKHTPFFFQDSYGGNRSIFIDAGSTFNESTGAMVTDIAGNSTLKILTGNRTEKTAQTYSQTSTQKDTTITGDESIYTTEKFVRSAKKAKKTVTGNYNIKCKTYTITTDSGNNSTTALLGIHHKAQYITHTAKTKASGIYAIVTSDAQEKIYNTQKYTDILALRTTKTKIYQDCSTDAYLNCLAKCDVVGFSGSASLWGFSATGVSFSFTLASASLTGVGVTLKGSEFAAKAQSEGNEHTLFAISLLRLRLSGLSIYTKGTVADKAASLKKVQKNIAVASVISIATVGAFATSHLLQSDKPTGEAALTYSSEGQVAERLERGTHSGNVQSLINDYNEAQPDSPSTSGGGGGGDGSRDRTTEANGGGASGGGGIVGARSASVENDGSLPLSNNGVSFPSTSGASSKPFFSAPSGSKPASTTPQVPFGNPPINKPK